VLPFLLVGSCQDTPLKLEESGLYPASPGLPLSVVFELVLLLELDPFTWLSDVELVEFPCDVLLSLNVLFNVVDVLL
jgi:hypothetical protein